MTRQTKTSPSKNQNSNNENRDLEKDKYAVTISPEDESKLPCVNREFQKLGPCNVSCVYRRTGTIVNLTTQRDLIKYKSILTKHNVKYRNQHTTLKYVIKGISPAYPPHEIQSELMDGGFRVVEVINMVSWATKRPLPMFRLTLDIESKDSHIEEVKVIGMHQIIIEPFKRKRKPPRCSNCLNLNHTAGRCKAPPKCKQTAQTNKTNQGTQNQQHIVHNTTNSIHTQTNTKTTTIHTQTTTIPELKTQTKNKRTKTIGTQTTPTKKPQNKKDSKTIETQTTVETTTRHMQTSTKQIKRKSTGTQTQLINTVISTQTDPLTLNLTEIREQAIPQLTIEERILLIKDLTGNDFFPESISDENYQTNSDEYETEDEEEEDESEEEKHRRLVQQAIDKLWTRSITDPPPDLNRTD